MSALSQQSSLAVPFGTTSEFVLAHVDGRNVFNFYPSLENAAMDADRANGLVCNTCAHRFTDADKWQDFQHGRARICTQCDQLTWPETTSYAPMTWEQFKQKERSLWLDPAPDQITKDKYWYALEVLPPMLWMDWRGVNSFLMSEFMSGVYTHQYVKHGHGDDATYWTKVVDATDRETWMTAESLKDLPVWLPCMTCGKQLAEPRIEDGRQVRGECAACKTGRHCDKRCGREARIGSALCDVCSGRIW